MLYNMLCCVMFMLCYIPCYVYVMLYKMLFYVMLYNMLCYVMLCYITCYGMVYNMSCYVTLYNMLVMLCYVTVQLVQKGQCNGKSRPKAADIVEVMVKLQRWVRTAHQIGTDYGLFEGVAVRCIVLFSWYLWHRPRYLFD